RADLGRREFLAAALDPCVAIIAADDLERDEVLFLRDHRVGHAPANQPLDPIERIVRIGNALALGRLANEALATLGKGDHGGGRPAALAILDHLGILAFHHGDAGIGRAEIDADDFSHSLTPYCGWVP